MAKHNLPIPEIEYLLRESASAETSFTPDRWTKENPTYGHCALFTVVAQNHVGGAIRRLVLPKDWEARLGYATHYVNISERGELIDLSKTQFPSDFPYEDLVGKPARTSGEDKREYLLGNKDTASRYRMLAENFEKVLHSNPLFLDPKFQLCWNLAFGGQSVCPKMRFAALVYADCSQCLVTKTVNRPMTLEFGKPRSCALDGSTCARMEMESRVDATIGDCGHALIWALAEVFSLGYIPSDLRLLDFYEAGFKPDGSPWWHDKCDYTCTYCENLFAMFRLDKIWVPFEGRWERAMTEESFYSAADYATGKQKVT